MTTAADIRVERVSKTFGGALAISEASFEVPHGDFAALLGPSGCGKSTLLRIIAGLEQPTGGRILIGGRDVTNAPPSERGVAMVFQSYALFPHLTVRDNILFGLSVRKTPAAEQKRRLDEAVTLLALGPYLDRKPSQLSGGQQQRVALGRAIVAQTPVCLMDEPLSNLDAQLRADMRREIRQLQQRLGVTMLYVTHDQVEAMTMADRVILMNSGHIEQDGAPVDLYLKPQTTFAARFIGAPPMNVVAGDALADLAPDHKDARAGLLVGVRPEDIQIADKGLPAEVVRFEYLGADTLIEARLGDALLLIRRQGQPKVAAGDTIALSCRPNDMHFFDSATGRRVD